VYTTIGEKGDKPYQTLTYNYSNDLGKVVFSRTQINNFGQKEKTFVSSKESKNFDLVTDECPF
jgi:hypothetical protein